MRSTQISALALAILPLLVAAQPHGHQHRHERREIVTEYATTTAPPVRVVVIVDAQGRPLSTSTVTLGETPPTPAPEPVKVDTPPKEAPSKQEPAKPVAAKPVVDPPKQDTPKPDPPKQDAPAPSPSPSPSGSSNSDSNANSGLGTSDNGVSYSPYTNAGGCKQAPEVSADMAKLKQLGFSMIRIYGTDCDQLKTIPPAAKENGIKIMAGVYNDQIKAGAVEKDVKMITDTFGNSWDQVKAVIIGNEPSLNGMSVEQSVAAYKTGRTALRSAGFQGPVMIAETYAAIKKDARICADVDVVAANIHAFFSKITPAEEAGKLVAEEADAVSKACGGKKVFVTESGWPHKGDNNGKAIPSRENQQKAMNSIKKSCSHLPLIQFTAFNDLWKKGKTG
ncbi:MAG: 1,3-beta-D-glucan synthase [Watsoniomyces obsoletus]|nr:MAG: 1,3-beta-D-glucan synthase [Watsoniomyces obsoletus]